MSLNSLKSELKRIYNKCNPREKAKLTNYHGFKTQKQFLKFLNNNNNLKQQNHGI